MGKVFIWVLQSVNKLLPLHSHLREEQFERGFWTVDISDREAEKGTLQVSAIQSRYSKRSHPISKF